MESNKPTTSSDEIDLGLLFTKIGNFFVNFGLGIIRFLALVRRVPLQNKTIFAIVITVCTAAGVGYSINVKKKFYESTMILSSDYLNKRLVDNAMEKLNLLAGEKTKKGIARVLNISDTLASDILEFRAKPFIAEKDVIELEVLKEQLKSAQGKNDKNDKVIDQVIERIEIENRHAFEITVRTSTPTVIIDLQTALVNFFRNNNYVRKRIEINKVNLEAKKAKLSRDLQKLDSLKFVIYDNYRNMATQKQGSNNVILSDKVVTNPVEIYNRDLFLYEDFQEVTSNIHLQKDFEVIDGFTEFSEPSSASLGEVGFTSILIGIGLAYLLVALVALNKYLATVL